MKEAVVKSVSEILTDEHGYTFIELELSDGAQGFFPNKEDFLELFYEGMEVKYREVKTFNNRPKIVGLLPNKKIKEGKMSVGKILNHSPWEFSPKKGKYYSTLTLEDGISGLVMVDSKDETLKFKVGEDITYEVDEVKGHNFFLAPIVHSYSPSVERDISIRKQVAFKAAVELFNSNPKKGRWLSNDDPTGLDLDAMVADVKTLTNKLLTIIS